MKDYRDDMTLGDIKSNDTDMLNDAIKGAKRYTFDNILKAKIFVKHCLDITLKRHGIKVNPPRTKNMFVMRRYEQELKKEFDKAKVEIESRGHNHYQGADVWKRGIYVFCNGELSAFISNPFKHIQEKHFQNRMMLPESKVVGFYVITNARIDTTQRVYGPVKQNDSKIIVPPSRVISDSKLLKGG
jgi:hypothetical protein